MEKHVLLAVLLLPLWIAHCLENPFEQGCLLEKIPGWTKQRVCNSDDPPNSKMCRQPEMEYMEIRIFSENWESVFFESWILQIILSELLDVPTTIETGTYEARLNFYDPDSPFGYGNTEDIQALTRAHEIKDCTLASREPDNYEICAHMLPEFWRAESEDFKEAMKQGYIEAPTGLGVVAFDTWFITKFTAVEDPTLDSYLGLQGEQNRRKLAETFLRPTTWKDYCELVSTNNCTIDDGVAKRAPDSEEELNRMFVDGFYTGHFRATEKNDCDLNPTTCTGHIADYPCGWESFVEAQTYHLNISLESDGDERGSGGYSYQQLVDMWEAANATKSNLIIMWWTPTNPQIHKFQGIDAEYHRVMLPVASQECLDNRVDREERCSEVLEERVGDPVGSCDKPSIPLMKLRSGSLYERTAHPSIPRAMQSPAYRVVQEFTISEVQLAQIFVYWQQEETPRDALCRWAAENFDYLESFVPPAYPRAVQDGNNWALIYTAIALGSIAVLAILVVTLSVHRKRKKPAIRYAQIGFLRLLLAGSLLIATGAIVTGTEPTDGKCIASIWLINIGYTLELVPLIVKVAAINTMMTAARRMRRITVRRRNLFGTVAFISFVMVIFLVLWTVLDIPRKEAEYELTQSETEDGHTIVMRSYYCSSDSIAWQYVAVGWNVLLLLCATVLAVQTRKLREDFNESRTLAFLIYSHFVFVILRLVTIFLSGNVQESTLRSSRSLIFSVDTIATIIIYFVPKLTGPSENTSRFGITVQSTNASTVLHHESEGLSRSSEMIYAAPADGDRQVRANTTPVDDTFADEMESGDLCASPTPADTDANRIEEDDLQTSRTTNDVTMDDIPARVDSDTDKMENGDRSTSPSPVAAPLLAGESKKELPAGTRGIPEETSTGDAEPPFVETKFLLVEGSMDSKTATQEGDTEDDTSGDSAKDVE